VLLAVTITLLIAVTMISAVAVRRRPALSPQMRAADDLLRRLSVTNGIALPLSAAGFALLAVGWRSIGAEPTEIEEWLNFAFGLAAIVSWWLNRRAGVDYLLRHKPRPEHELVLPAA